MIQKLYSTGKGNSRIRGGTIEKTVKKNSVVDTQAGEIHPQNIELS